MSGLGVVDGIVLGLVEGLTEYLPVSSTGHLLVATRVLGISDPATSAAVDAYVVAIQSGAILAVLVLFPHRISQLARGIIGRSPEGRQIAAALALAFVPAAVTGLAAGDAVKSLLFGVRPVAVAWIVGGLAILATRNRRWMTDGSIALESMRTHHALVIGVVQAVALWPGISRSLVTILAGLYVGCSMKTAVEFSFLLGLVTLGAATAYEAASTGPEIVSQFGVTTPLVGIFVAFLAAVLSMRWMVTWLQKRGLGLFAWYRLGLGSVVLLSLAVT